MLRAAHKCNLLEDPEIPDTKQSEQCRGGNYENREKVMNTYTAPPEASCGARIFDLHPCTMTKKNAALTRSGLQKAMQKLCTRIAMKSMRLRTAHRTFIHCEGLSTGLAVNLGVAR